jgi:hypothetical protein
MTCVLGFHRGLVAQAAAKDSEHWANYQAKFNLVSKDGLPGLTGLAKAGGEPGSARAGEPGAEWCMWPTPGRHF